MKKNDLIKDLIKRCETTNEHLRASVMIRGKSIIKELELKGRK